MTLRTFTMTNRLSIFLSLFYFTVLFGTSCSSGPPVLFPHPPTPPFSLGLGEVVLNKCKEAVDLK